jgi:hypothetical protein
MAGVSNWADTVGNSIWITGLQLEVGTVATPFEHRPYGTELSLCQRYFEKSYNQDTAVGTVTTNGAVNYRMVGGGAGSQAYIPFASEKRAAPTVTFFNPSTGASGTWNSAGSQSGAKTVFSNIASGTRGLTWVITVAADQVHGHWTALSEL